MGKSLGRCPNPRPAPSTVSSEVTETAGLEPAQLLESPQPRQCPCGGKTPRNPGLGCSRMIFPSSWRPWAAIRVCDCRLGAGAVGEELEVREARSGCSERFLGSRLPELGVCPRISRGFLWLSHSSLKLCLVKTPFGVGRSRVRRGRGALGVTAGWAQPGPGSLCWRGIRHRVRAESRQAQSSAQPDPRDASTEPLPCPGAGIFSFVVFNAET